MPTKHMVSHHHLFTPRDKKSVDMTQGNIWGHLIQFAFPLLLGNIFQQLYNTVDTWVVGNFVSNEAFSAVGSVSPIINMLIGAFGGLASGAGVVISQYYGAKRFDQVEKSVHTAAVMTLVLAVVFTALGHLLVSPMLTLMRIPDVVRPEATLYLRIYFSGLIGLMVYNMGAGILRAVGDSQRPFYFLLVCALLNTVLDLLFVLVFHMGVEGVALATILSQGVSATLVTVSLLTTSDCIRVRVSRLKADWALLKKIIRVGIPAALQMAVTAFSNVFVQSYVNAFGPDCMSGWTAYSKIDQVLFLPMQSIALSSTTFVGQNLGSGQVDRAKSGIRKSLLLALCSTVLLAIPVLCFAPHLVGFFNKKPEVVEYGTVLLRHMTPFYVLCCINQVYAGALRGAGNSKAPTIIMLCSFVGFRQLYLFIMSRICNSLIPIAMGYPAGWFLCSALTLIYYHRTRLDKTRLVEDAPK